MKDFIRFLILNYHFQMILKYDKKIKSHHKKYNALFDNKSEKL